MATHSDPGHILPEDAWQKVVSIAESHPENPSPRTGQLATEHDLRKLGTGSFPSVTGYVKAKYNGGTQPSGPTFGVLHDAETPLSPGYARGIANYFASNTNETSAHFMIDPIDTIQMLDTSLVAWHCGNGNTRSIGVEQAGYAGFTSGQWTTADGMRQMGRVAKLMQDIHHAHGIGLFWMSDQQLRDAWAGHIVGGWTTHDQCRRVLGGTTHTDPMPNYPFAHLMEIAAGSPPPAPTPPPAPRPTHPGTFAWNLAAGNYYANWHGPMQAHGGYYSSEKPYVRLIQQWFIYKGCVPGVPASSWAWSTWADGLWESATDTAAINWHNRYYPRQPKPTQIWRDDAVRLMTP